MLACSINRLSSHATCRKMDHDLDPIKPLTRKQHNALVDCCLGAYEEVWYKFKRFEDLSLLNLYYYQHQLVLLDKEIFGNPHGENFESEPLSNEKWRQIRRYLKGYRKHQPFRHSFSPLNIVFVEEALQLFKQTQQQQRPPWKKRECTLKLLKRKMKEDHYLDGHDAKGMLDLCPDVLGVGHDSIRSKLQAWGDAQNRQSGAFAISMGPHQDHPNYPSASTTRRMENIPKGPKPAIKRYSFLGRPYQVPQNPAVDRFIRCVVAVIAAATLLVPLLALSYISQRDYTIMATCLFVLLFAFIVSMISKASTTDVMVAVATYAAVLVVFVGQTIGPPA